jgi:hypothetical protein
MIHILMDSIFKLIFIDSYVFNNQYFKLLPFEFLYNILTDYSNQFRSLDFETNHKMNNTWSFTEVLTVSKSVNQVC